jgi:hypothetical protein
MMPVLTCFNIDQIGPNLGQIGPKQPIFKVETLAYCTFLRILTTTSAYIGFFELTPVKIWVKWTKIGSIVGPNLAQKTKESSWTGVPMEVEVLLSFVRDYKKI